MSKYDAVVIGSGTGGLSAALSLATAGKKILLLEQHNMPGGCATSFVRGRFEFDASLHEFCSLGYPGNWAMTGKLLMEKYKLDIDWCLVPELYRCIGTTRSGKHFDLRLPCGVEEFIKAMADAVPGCEKPMRTFIDLAEECSAAYDYFNEHWGILNNATRKSVDECARALDDTGVAYKIEPAVTCLDRPTR